MPNFSDEPMPGVSDQLACDESEDTERMLRNMNQAKKMQVGHHSIYPKTIAETDLLVRYQKQKL